MSQQQNPVVSARRIQDILRKAGIESMVIGGIAVAVWGDPRVTKDADLKVILNRNQIDLLLRILPEGYHCLSADPGETLKRFGFVLFEDPDGVRCDLLLAETCFDESAMKRSQDLEAVPGISLRLCTPEDLIVYKLISTRARDHEDVSGVVRRQGPALDDSYVEEWLRQFEQALDDSTLISRYREMRRGGEERNG